LQFAEASTAAIATAREGYVLASVVEEKMADLQWQLDEAMKSLQEKTSTADD
jgi:tetrahydromethanopterin S-methyltransferase subunit B